MSTRLVVLASMVAMKSKYHYRERDGICLSYGGAQTTYDSSLNTDTRDEGRLRALESVDLQKVLDSCLFEPGVWAPDVDKPLPEVVPSEQGRVTATSCGLLVNELICSPEVLVRSLLDIVERTLDFDTGTYQSPSAPVILYVIRMAVRVEEYMSAVVRCLRAMQQGSGGAGYAAGGGCVESCASLLGLVPTSVVAKLQDARVRVVGTLRGRAYAILETWRGKLTSSGHLSEACEVLAHMAYLYRNAEWQQETGGGMNEVAVETLLTCQVRSTTAHIVTIAKVT